MDYVTLKIEFSDEVYYPLLERSKREGKTIVEVTQDILKKWCSEQTADSSEDIKK